MKVDTPKNSQIFVQNMGAIIRVNFDEEHLSRRVECFNIFFDLAKKHLNRSAADCNREIARARSTAQIDRNISQEAFQAKLDRVEERERTIVLQVDACKALASAVGISLTKTASQTATRPKTGKSTPPSQSSVASLDELLNELHKLTGLDTVKSDVCQQIDFSRVEQMRREAGLPVTQVSKHLVFKGNPGTGKTTVARLLAQLYTAIGVLKNGQLIEVTRNDLVAGYVGQTAIKTTKAVERAIGGILFIDEAYSLSRSIGSSQDFGSEAIDTLVKLMEDHRDELVVIAAGYSEEMDQFIRSNPGLASRFPRTIIFPDYSTDELVLIFQGMCAEGKYQPSPEALDSLKRHFVGTPRTSAFGNARLVRNIFESAIVRQASRIIATNNPILTELTVSDLGL